MTTTCLYNFNCSLVNKSASLWITLFLGPDTNTWSTTARCSLISESSTRHLASPRVKYNPITLLSSSSMTSGSHRLQAPRPHSETQLLPDVRCNTDRRLHQQQRLPTASSACQMHHRCRDCTRVHVYGGWLTKWTDKRWLKQFFCIAVDFSKL